MKDFTQVELYNSPLLYSQTIFFHAFGFFRITILILKTFITYTKMAQYLI